MKRIAFLLAAISLAATSANAQDSRSTLLSANNSTFYPNGIGAITGAKQNAFNANFINSVAILDDSNVWTGNNTFTTYPTLAGLVASQTAMTPSNLYSICQQGNPAITCTGIISSSTGNLDYSRGGGFDAYAQTVIYESTHLGTSAYETALDISFNVNTGYCASPYTNCGDRAALQISAFANPGGGTAWASAMSITFQPGWAPSTGNFGTTLELDPSNNASANTDPTNYTAPITSISGLWVAGPIGLYAMTDFIQVANTGGNGSVYGAHVGLWFVGSYLTDKYTIWDEGDNGVGSNIASYQDSGSHITGINLAGNYSGQAIYIAGTGSGLSSIEDQSARAYGLNFVGNYSATIINTASTGNSVYVLQDSSHQSTYGIVMSGTYLNSIIDLAGSGTPTNAILDTGSRSYGLNLSGTYGIAAINIAATTIGISLAAGDQICFGGNVDCASYVSANSAITFTAPIRATGFSAGASPGVTSTTCTAWTNGLCTHS